MPGSLVELEWSHHVVRFEMSFHRENHRFPLRNEVEEVVRVLDVGRFVGRDLKTLGELGDKVRLGRRRTNLDENVIGEAVTGCFVISSSDWSVDGSCDVEGDISNGGCHDGRSEVESDKGCARL